MHKLENKMCFNFPEWNQILASNVSAQQMLKYCVTKYGNSNARMWKLKHCVKWKCKHSIFFKLLLFILHVRKIIQSTKAFPVFVKNYEGSKMLFYLQVHKWSCQFHRCWQESQDRTPGSEIRTFITHSTESTRFPCSSSPVAMQSGQAKISQWICITVGNLSFRNPNLF